MQRTHRTGKHWTTHLLLMGLVLAGSLTARAQTMPSATSSRGAKGQAAQQSANRGGVHPQKAVDALEVNVRQRYEYALQLAERGAFFSAEEELKQALWVVASDADRQLGVSTHRDAVDAAFVALTEADDFAAFFGPRASYLSLPQIAASHRTPVDLSGDEGAEDAYGIMQRYLRFAEESLVAAIDHEPVASEVLFGLGKVNEVATRQAPRGGRVSSAKSIVFYRSALSVNVQNVAAANELAVLLSKFGHVEEAKRVLVGSVSPQAPREVWQNLTRIHSQLGEQQLASRAHEVYVNSHRQEPATVKWVSPSKFSGQVEPGLTINRPPAAKPANVTAQTNKKPTANTRARTSTTAKAQPSTEAQGPLAWARSFFSRPAANSKNPKKPRVESVARKESKAFVFPKSGPNR